MRMTQITATTLDGKQVIIKGFTGVDDFICMVEKTTGVSFSRIQMFEDSIELTKSRIHMTRRFIEEKKPNIDVFMIMSYASIRIMPSNLIKMMNGGNVSLDILGMEMLHGDIKGWDVSFITDMADWFLGQDNFNKDISIWNVSSVIDMSSIFRKCYIFSSDISGWDVSSVTDMSRAFEDCYCFNANISGWDVRQVENMNRTFFGCDAFSHSISLWDTQSLKQYSDIVCWTYCLHEDVSQWEKKHRGLTEANTCYCDTCHLPK